MTSSHTPASAPEYAVRIKDGSSIVADHTRPTSDLAEAREHLSTLRIAYRDSVLLMRERGSRDGKWLVATDDTLKRIAFQRAVATIAHLVADTRLPLIGWGIYVSYLGDAASVYAHTDPDTVGKIADALGVEVEFGGRSVDVRTQVEGVEVHVNAYTSASKAASKAAA